MQIDNNSESRTYVEVEQCDAFDFDRFTQRLLELAAKRGLHIRNLGSIGGNPLILLTPPILNEGPRLLVAAAFHGDEPAGCWGILRFLEGTESPGPLNLSFLPLVNPSGFRQQKRTNIWGEDPNRGFFYNYPIIDRSSGEPPPSREGQILLMHASLLMSLASQGFLSLHEDMEYSKYYMYAFEKPQNVGSLSQVLRAEASKFFEVFPDGPLEGGFVRDGVILDYHDGSFEDFLFQSGIPQTACTESPGLIDINKRIEANSRLITTFAEFAIARSM